MANKFGTTKPKQPISERVPNIAQTGSSQPESIRYDITQIARPKERAVHNRPALSIKLNKTLGFLLTLSLNSGLQSAYEMVRFLIFLLASLYLSLFGTRRNPYFRLLFILCCALKQPQGDYIELHRKRNGYRLDHFERKRKKEAREVHKRSEIAQKVF